MEIGKVEYQVRKVERFIITRYAEDEQGRPGGSEMKGEYESAGLAHEIAFALARDEHQRLGWGLGDERMQYPKREMAGAA